MGRAFKHCMETNIFEDKLSILCPQFVTNNWFNKTHGLHLKKEELFELLEVAEGNQLFPFDGQL